MRYASTNDKCTICNSELQLELTTSMANLSSISFSLSDYDYEEESLIKYRYVLVFCISTLISFFLFLLANYIGIIIFKIFTNDEVCSNIYTEIRMSFFFPGLLYLIVIIIGTISLSLPIYFTLLLIEMIIKNILSLCLCLCLC